MTSHPQGDEVIDVTDGELAAWHEFKSELVSNPTNRLYVTSRYYPHGELIEGTEVDEWLRLYMVNLLSHSDSQNGEWLDEVLEKAFYYNLQTNENWTRKNWAKQAILAELHKREAAARVDEQLRTKIGQGGSLHGQIAVHLPDRVVSQRQRIAQLQQPKQEGK